MNAPTGMREAALRYAARYAARGWRVFPCEVDGKRPHPFLAPNGHRTRPTTRR